MFGDRVGAQVVKVSRLTGEILHRGYIHDDTRMSESAAECASDNVRNIDPSTAFIIIQSDSDFSYDTILDKVREWELTGRLGINYVFAGGSRDL